MRPARAVTPTQQRLDPDDATRREVDERLVVQLELATTYGPPQVALGRHPLEQVVVHVRLEPYEGQPAVALRAVHREIRVTQQQIRVLVTLVVDRDPDAGTDQQLAATDPELAVQHALHAVRDPDRLAVDLVGDDEDPELVASEAGDDVVGTYGVPEPLGDQPEQLVTDRVTWRVVDALESVEVEEQHGNGAHRAARRTGVSACSTRLRKTDRLARPVSGSEYA